MPLRQTLRDFSVIGFANLFFAVALGLGGGFLDNSPVLAQNFYMLSDRSIRVTIHEVKGRGQYREAWLTWFGRDQQVSQHKKYDCISKKYIFLSTNGVPTGQAIKSAWTDDNGSGEIQYVCSR